MNEYCASSPLNPNDSSWADHFWLFSTSFYHITEAQLRLLSLQNSAGISVNKVLFALWFTQYFQAVLGPAFVQRINQQSTKVNSTIVQVRATRKAFDQLWAKPLVGEIATARFHLIQSELTLEKEMQLQMVRCIADYRPATKVSLDKATAQFIAIENIDLLVSQPGNREQTTIRDLVGIWLQELDNRS